MMETPKKNIETLFANAGEFIENKKELWKLSLIDKSSEAISSIVEKLIVFIIAIIFFVFFSVALALLIGYWMGQSFYGFFIMAAFYGIVGFIFHASRNKLIKTPITNSIIQKFLN